VYCETLCMFAAYRLFIVCARHLETKRRQYVTQNPRTKKTSAQLHWIQRVSSLTAHSMFSSFPIYRVYLKYFDILQEWFLRTKKDTQIDIREHLIFEVHLPSSLRFSRFDCYIWKHLRNPNVFLLNWKLRDALPTRFWCLLNYSHPPLDLRKGAIIHDQKWMRGHWIQVDDILNVCCEFWLDKQ
jgi:hypothetical protein